jgi:hypothetical protein
VAALAAGDIDGDGATTWWRRLPTARSRPRSATPPARWRVAPRDPGAVLPGAARAFAADVDVDARRDLVGLRPVGDGTALPVSARGDGAGNFTPLNGADFVSHKAFARIRLLVTEID